MPPPAAASRGFSMSLDCVRARVDTMINHSTEIMVVGIFQVVQFGGVDVDKNTRRFCLVFGCPAQPDSSQSGKSHEHMLEGRQFQYAEWDVLLMHNSGTLLVEDSQ
jgi:hypothetical protein